MHGEERKRVGADRIEGDVAEVEEAGPADGDVEPEREQGGVQIRRLYLRTDDGLVLRAVKAYGLPNALRMTIGSAEANGLVIEALGAFMRGDGASNGHAAAPRG